MACSRDALFVDTVEQLRTLLDKLVDLDPLIPQLFLDLEGHNISHGGKLSILQLVLMKEPRIYLIDLVTLGELAFSTRGSSGQSLRYILECQSPAKAIFDVRADSHALYRHYGIRLAGMHDIQLMQVATGRQAQKFLSGLAKCIEYDISLSLHQRRAWLASKEAGKRLFDQRYGGAYAVFDQRPLSAAVKTYCVQDVVLMPALWLHYYSKLTQTWLRRVLAESQVRIQESQKATFSGGQHMAFAPSKWLALQRDAPGLSPANVPEGFRIQCQTLLDQLEGSSQKPPAKPASSDFDLSKILATLQTSNCPSGSTKYNAERLKGWDPDDESGTFLPQKWESHSVGSDDDEASKDFTACSADDCGYCGHCSY